MSERLYLARTLRYTFPDKNFPNARIFCIKTWSHRGARRCLLYTPSELQSWKAYKAKNRGSNAAASANPGHHKSPRLFGLQKKTFVSQLLIRVIPTVRVFSLMISVSLSVRNLYEFYTSSQQGSIFTVTALSLIVVLQCHRNGMSKLRTTVNMVPRILILKIEFG